MKQQLKFIWNSRYLRVYFGIFFIFNIFPIVCNTKEHKINPISPETRIIKSKHYTVHTTATHKETKCVIVAVEALYNSYIELFGNKKFQKKMQLVLYKDREQLRENNQSAPIWAEAYYLFPRSYAYYANAANPYHWMIHEVAHQLMREVSGYNNIAKWNDEGVASYFGASKVSGMRLFRGKIDVSAYPIWWLPSYKLTGDLQQDKENGNIISLEHIITNTGPDISKYVNIYYIHYWSITHFLFHYKNGIYAKRYKELIISGGSKNDFIRLIGPIKKIEQEWYSYLLKILKPIQDSR